nr:hypothetical protein [Gluconobacter sp. Dm-62]
MNSLTSLQTLLSALAGKHGNDAVAQDLALIGTALSVPGRTLVPHIAPYPNLVAIEAGLVKAFNGITDIVTAIESKLMAELNMDADPFSTQTELLANA